MLEKLLGLVSGRVGLYIALGVMALSMATCASQVIPLRAELRATNNQLKTTRGELDDKTARLAQCETNRTTLQAGIDAANANVERQRQEAEIAAAEGDRKLQAALKLAQTYRNREEALRKAKPTSPDQCIAAQSLIVQTLGQERQ